MMDLKLQYSKTCSLYKTKFTSIKSYKTLFSLIFYIFLNIIPTFAHSHEGCKYNGKILDTSKSPSEIGTKFITAVPDDFTGKKECYHTNSKISETSDYVKGQKNGMMKSFDDKGHLTEEAQMKDNVRHGFFKRYHHKTHKLIQEYQYKMGEYIGLSKEYFEDSGKIKSLRMITPDQSGSEMYFNKLGKMTHLSCKPKALPDDKDLCGRNGMGKKVSLYFQDNDKVSQTLTYKNLKLEGEVINFNQKNEVISKKVYKNGDLLSEEHFSPKGNYKRIIDGKKTTETFHYASGKLKQILVKIGFNIISDVEFYENGSKKSEYELKDNVVYTTTYYDNNKINCKYTSKNRKGYIVNDGPYNCFYEDGKPSVSENYLEAKLDGEQSYFATTGLISKKSNYKNGQLLESWFYDDKGELIKNEQYEPDGSRKLSQ